MNKEEFLALLEQGLSGLPRDEAAERLEFYREMIEDRMEEGLSEQEAVAELGPVEAIVAQTVAEIPLPRLVRERLTPARRFQAWEIVLLILGFPVWFPLLIAAGAVLLSVYIVIWAVILSLWAVNLSLAVAALACAAAPLLAVQGAGMPILALIGAALALAGLTILLFLGCRAVTGGAAGLTGRLALWVKSLFLRKERET